MQQNEIIDRLNRIQLYLQSRKEYLFKEIEQLNQQIDSISGDIQEKEAYIELESSRQQLESNIFTLYDTTEQYEEKKSTVLEQIEELHNKKSLLKKQLEDSESELEEVNQNLVSNGVVIKYYENQFAKKEAEEEQEHRKRLNITNQLKLCLGTLELDKERCAMELGKLIEELQKENCE